MTNAEKWGEWLDQEKLRAGYAQFTQVCKANQDIPVTFEQWVELQINKMPVENKIMDLENAAYHLQEAITNLENVAANDDAGASYKSYLIETLKLRLHGQAGTYSIESWIYEIKNR
jgi:hypothetical protein